MFIPPQVGRWKVWTSAKVRDMVEVQLQEGGARDFKVRSDLKNKAEPIYTKRTLKGGYGKKEYVNRGVQPTSRCRSRRQSGTQANVPTSGMWT